MTDAERLIACVQQAKDAGLAWCPVFIDVRDAEGNKHGHLASDGYTHSVWRFYPAWPGRRVLMTDVRLFGRTVISPAELLPKWALPATFDNWRVGLPEGSAP